MIIHYLYGCEINTLHDVTVIDYRQSNNEFQTWVVIIRVKRKNDIPWWVFYGSLILKK